jgi:hypothetical protein
MVQEITTHPGLTAKRAKENNLTADDTDETDFH